MNFEKLKHSVLRWTARRISQTHEAIKKVILPEELVFIRHAEQEGQVDQENYKLKPDYAMELTPKGKMQAEILSGRLRLRYGDTPIGIYVSTAFRAQQTATIATYGLNRKFWISDSRLREQEWSGGLVMKNVDMRALRKEREEFGHFHFRFHGGESCADVEDRFGGFLNTFYRDIWKIGYPKVILFFGHGMTSRVAIKRWTKASIREFELWKNLENCEQITLKLNKKIGKYYLPTHMRSYDVPDHPYQLPD